MYRTTKALRNALFSLATVALAGSSPAFAFSYPGAMCVKYSGGTASPDGNAHLENTGSSTLYAICPIAVDDPTDSDGTTSNVFVTDLSSSAGVCCEQRVKVAGSSYSAGSSICTSTTGYSSSYQTLSPTTPTTDYTFTHRYFYCSVPATGTLGTSEIRTYRFYED